jgi:hypothetical protein
MWWLRRIDEEISDNFASSTIFSLSAEIRSLWVLPWNITSPSQIDQVIEDAIAANQTELW